MWSEYLHYRVGRVIVIFHQGKPAANHALPVSSGKTQAVLVCHNESEDNAELYKATSSTPKSKAKGKDGDEWKEF